MKRLKSIKPPTMQCYLKTPSFIKQIPQPGKPPTHEKQLPNYMKSTSSFEARKKQSQVKSRASLKSPKKDSKTSKPSSNSAHLQAKMLTGTSSLKKVRTLTKTFSFKPGVAKKKCPRVVLCKNLNSQRATCSSTLKDSKFPNYLELSHGATETEGTSITKACPYTYCSLNGHRHAHLPPLKSFLSATRHMLKTQKNIKLGCLSPRRTKPSGDLEGAILRDILEDRMDFYIDIYVEKREDDSKIISGSNGDGDVDGLSNEESYSGNDFETNLGECCEVMTTDVQFFPREEQIGEETMEVDSGKSNQEEETAETVSNQSDMELNRTDSEIYDSENNTQVFKLDICQPNQEDNKCCQDLQSNTVKFQITKREKSENGLAKERDFNPREPNYLPITPDPEAEKVDLRHQDLDDRKNAEEWMIDYALQQTVTKLAPARKRKVALLVEAFEKVIPPHFEPQLKHTSSAFGPVKPIQACN